MTKHEDGVSQFAAYPRSDRQFSVEQTDGVCAACGGAGPFSYKQIINDKLAAEWGLTIAERHAFSARESMFCGFCGCSYRLRALARAISLYILPGTNASLKDLIDSGRFKGVKVAEINSCGVLHDILRDIPGLAYSEFESNNPGVRSEDLAKLTYTNDSFDLVLTSDTLEHVPDPKQGLTEISRVLKPAGAHIFTVPVRLDKQTVKRARLAGKKINHKLVASYHGSGEPDYLVWNDFGGDFLTTTNEVFSYVYAYFMNTANLKDPSCVIVASNRKPKQPAATFDIALDQSRQIERVAALINKLELTVNHANNLEAINASIQRHTEELNKRLVATEKKLQRTPAARARRLASTTKRALRSKR